MKANKHEIVKKVNLICSRAIPKSILELSRSFKKRPWQGNESIIINEKKKFRLWQDIFNQICILIKNIDQNFSEKHA